MKLEILNNKSIHFNEVTHDGTTILELVIKFSVLQNKIHIFGK